MVSVKNQLSTCSTQTASGKRLLQLTRSIAAISVIPCTHHDQELIDAPSSSDMMSAEFIPSSLLSLTRFGTTDLLSQIKSCIKGMSLPCAGAIKSVSTPGSLLLSQIKSCIKGISAPCAAAIKSTPGFVSNGVNQVWRAAQWLTKRPTLDWSKGKSIKPSNVKLQNVQTSTPSYVSPTPSHVSSTLDWSKGKSIKTSNVNLQNVQTSTPSWVSSTPSLANAANTLLERPADLMKEVKHLIFKEDVMTFNKCLKSQWGLRLKHLTKDEQTELEEMVKESEKYTEFVGMAKKRWAAVKAYIS